MDKRLIMGALIAASRSLAKDSGDNPDFYHIYMPKAARCNAAFMRAMDSHEFGTLLDHIADIWEGEASG